MNASGVQLREGGARDIAEIMETMVGAFDPAFGEAWSRAQCLAMLDLSGVWVTLARLDGVPAGFALSRIVVDEAELLLLGVRPAARRNGVGRALLERSMVLARAFGARRIHLEVRESNTALSLYRSAGFTEIGRRPAYYRGGGGELFDALTLGSSLSNP